MTGGRLAWIEGARGLAALSVCLSHFLSAFFPFMMANIYPDAPAVAARYPLLESALRLPPFNLLFKGPFAVSLFFALSGLALTLGYFRSGERRVLVDAALKRYPRLALPVLAALLLAAALWSLGLMRIQQVGALNGSAWALGHYDGAKGFAEALGEALRGALLLGGPAAIALDNVLWTMKPELFGSLLLFAFWGLRGGGPGLVLAALCYLAYGWQAGATNVCLALALLAGSFAAPLALRGARWPRLGPACILAGLALGSADYAGLLAMDWPGAAIGLNQRDLLDDIGAVLLVAGLAVTPGAQQLLESRFCRFAGRLSFPLYLLHVPLLCSLGAAVFLALHPLGYGIAALAALLAWGGVALACARWFSLAIDIPAQQAARRLAQMAQPRWRPVTPL